MELALEASKDRHNPNPLQHFDEMATEAAQRILAAAAAKAKAAHVQYEVKHVPNKRAGDAIVDLADAIHADAYTAGDDIVFGAGRYAPHSESGRTILAHELAHVAQQVSWPRPGGGFRLSRPDALAERSAAKDSAVGHWELMGHVTHRPPPV